MMPQVDKSASTYSPPVQYVSAISPPPVLPRSDINKYSVVSGDILKSCDWSAVIHRPAEDSEPEDLPSTVDMDAIKEPSTPLPPPLTPGPSNSQEQGSDSDDDSSGSESEEESSSDTNSDSQDGSESGTCSWSDSDSSESSDKRRSSCSSRSESPQTTFSIRETNIDQGGLKLKISATKPKVKSRDQSSSSSDAYDSSSSDESEKPEKPVLRKKVKETEEPEQNKVESKSVKKEVATRNKKEDDEKVTVMKTRTAVKNEEKSVKPEPKAKETKSNPPAVKQRAKLEEKVSTRKSSSRLSSLKRKENSPVPSAKSNAAEKQVVVRGCRTRFRAAALKKASAEAKEKNKSVGSGVKSVIASEAGSTDEDNDDEEGDDGESGSGDEIAHLAQQFGAPEQAIPISEQLQVINQEDLAAILPDVGGGGSFDGFEDVSCSGDVSSSRGGPPPRPPRANGSGVSSGSSDVELLPEQDQIVSEAINRINLDSDNGKEERQPANHSTQDEDSEREEVGYSSNLLEQFVEKTEMLSRGDVGVNIVEGEAKSKSSEEPKRRKRGRPPKQAVQQQQDGGGNHCMPELEAFMRLDCSQSNVSPDSGIQSVAGSPSHQSCSPASAHSPPPPILKPSSPQPSPQPPPTRHYSTNRIRARNADPILYPPRRKPPQSSIHQNKPVTTNVKLSNLYTTITEAGIENGGKRGPGRPKGSTRKRKGRRVVKIEKTIVLPPAVAELRVPPYFAAAAQNKSGSSSTSSIPNLPGIPGKRGPGRPKKTPPTLEPILPLEKCSGGKAKRGNEDKIVNSTRVKGSTGLPAKNVKNGKELKSGTRCMKTCSALVNRGKYSSIAHCHRKQNLCLPKGLMRIKRHKHKKRKKPLKEFELDPKFLSDLEKLASDFEKMCFISTGGHKPCTDGSQLPAIFRVKRIIKKRKGSERSAKASDKESGAEGDNNHKEKCGATPVAAVQATPNTAKRRIKKSTVEVPKNREKPEANNEQRLPLKKRHYHMSGTSAALSQSGSDTVDKSESSLEAKVHLKAALPTNEKVTEKHVGGKNGHISGKTISQTNNNGKVGTVKPETRRIDHPRNSIDEAIEACITKYADHESVIVTPKKRHRLEMEKKSVNGIKSISSKEKESLKTPIPTKRVISRLSSTNNQIRSTSPQGQKRGSSRNAAVKLETDVPKAPSSPSLKGSISQNLITQVSSPVKRPQRNHSCIAASDLPASTDSVNDNVNSEVPVSPKRSVKGTEDNSNSVLPNSSKKLVLGTEASEPTKNSHIENKCPQQQKLDLSIKHVNNSLNSLGTRSSSKGLALSSELPPVITSVPSLAENTSPKSPRCKVEKKPPAGVFEPSSKSDPDALVNLIKIPDSPVKCVAAVLSKIKDKLNPIENLSIDIGESFKNLRVKRATDEIDEGEQKDKKRKVICDLRVHVTKLTPTDQILKKVMSSIKLKVRRRKTINRTGFPIKKKKKKKCLSFEQNSSSGQIESDPSPPPVLEDQTKLPVVTSTDESTPALSPITKVEEMTKVKDEEKFEANKEIKVEKPVIKSELNPNIELAQNNDKFLPKSVEKTDQRPGSKRIMELRAKTIASERRKRKSEFAGEMPSQEVEQSSESSSSCQELNTFKSKRLRKTKEEHYDSDADSVRSRKKNPPRWRKKYLPAGLFSDYYKEDEPRKTTNGDFNKCRAAYVANEHQYGLLPPPTYCSKWVRQRKMHFQLPHDLWWLHVNNLLPGRDSVPSWNYKKIRTNVYYDVKPTYNYETQACSCTLAGDTSCGEDCINRMVFSECSPQLCPCKEKCSNQKIQRHEWAPGLAKFMTKDKGWGVKTKYHIKNGEFILEYVGEVVSEREFKSRMASRYQNDTHHYCLNLDGGLVIDGHRMGGDGRFVNHSCEPNCEMQKWSVNGLFRMALFALRDIHPNEELTYDYNFSLFNPAEGQPCKCGSSKCRGVIGGKSQRVPVTHSRTSAFTVNEDKPVASVGRPRKNSRKANSVGRKVNKAAPKEAKIPIKENSATALATVAARLSHLTPIRPLSHQQKTFVSEHKCFLLRNLEKVKQLREKLKLAVRGGQLSVSEGEKMCSMNQTPVTVKQSEVFLTQLNALSCPRSIRTRRLAQAEDNPEMTKTARLACIFKHLYNAVSSAKDESGELLSAPFVTLPSRRKFPLYYQRITNPIDLSTVEQNIVTGVYKTVESFDEDMTQLFKNNVRWYGRTSELGIAATRLRKIYNIAKLDCVEKLKDILGEDPPASFIPHHEDPGGEEEDVIRCICGLFKDEGLMIQCERCLVWQHCDCVQADTSIEHYLCERCQPRVVDLEIPMQEQPEYATSGQKHFITLLRGKLQLKQGDTVYVLRDIVNEASTCVPKSKHTYLTIKNWKFSDCDIFKIERLWKDEKGDRFAFGHHFLRPHETYHEPTRKFFSNEVMRVPLYEVVPLDLIMGHCYVLDLNTFCKGRPINSDPEHIYICEYRVDKYARLFAKIARPKHSIICTKSYAFEMYDTRLKPQRTYAPHGTPKNGSVSRGRGGRSAQHTEETVPPQVPPSLEEDTVHTKQICPQAKRAEQKLHLNQILLKLLSRLPTKQPLDLSYLLEPGRRQRKKPALLSS